MCMFNSKTQYSFRTPTTANKQIEAQYLIQFKSLSLHTLKAHKKLIELAIISMFQSIRHTHMHVNVSLNYQFRHTQNVPITVITER